MNLRKDHCTHKVAANPLANLTIVPLLVESCCWGAAGGGGFCCCCSVCPSSVPRLRLATSEVVVAALGSGGDLVLSLPNPIAQCINTLKYD